MNDLQKKFAIVGATAFIVWFFVGVANDMIGELIDYGLKYDFFEYAITDTWYQIVLFIIWIGSLIAFFIYKD